MVHWWMQVVETGGAPGDAGLMVTWPLHVPLKSGYVTGAVELLQPAHVIKTKMLIDFQKRDVIPVTRFLSIMGSVRRRRGGGGRDSVAAYTADRPSPHDGDGPARFLPRCGPRTLRALLWGFANLFSDDGPRVFTGATEVELLAVAFIDVDRSCRLARGTRRSWRGWLRVEDQGVRGSIGLRDAIVTSINWLR